MTTFKAFGLAAVLVILTLSFSYGQETVTQPTTEIVVVDTDTATF